MTVVLDKQYNKGLHFEHTGSLQSLEVIKILF